MNNFAANIARPESGLPDHDGFIVGPDDRILVTGAAGFIGSRVVQNLLDRGFRNLVCFVRPSSEMAGIDAMIERRPAGSLNRSAERKSSVSRGLRSSGQGRVRHLSLSRRDRREVFSRCIFEFSGGDAKPS